MGLAWVSAVSPFQCLPIALMSFSNKTEGSIYLRLYACMNQLSTGTSQNCKKQHEPIVYRHVAKLSENGACAPVRKGASTSSATPACFQSASVNGNRLRICSDPRLSFESDDICYNYLILLYIIIEGNPRADDVLFLSAKFLGQRGAVLLHSR